MTWSRPAHAKSLSARRAWIEITSEVSESESLAVALRKESVDRNYDTYAKVLRVNVALRKESVDRNIQTKNTPKIRKVALRKESVDRNQKNTNAR